MQRWEKLSIILWAVVNGSWILILGAVSCLGLVRHASFASSLFMMCVAATWAVWGWFNIGLTIRDIFRRPLKRRWLWLLFIAGTTLPGWIIYLALHGWRPRHDPDLFGESRLDAGTVFISTTVSFAIVCLIALAIVGTEYYVTRVLGYRPV